MPRILPFRDEEDELPAQSGQPNPTSARTEPVAAPYGTGHKKRPPAFQFYAKDWLASPTVRTMTLAEVGAYINLLASAWDNDPVAMLPNQPAKLWRFAGAQSPEEWAVVASAVLVNFEVEGDRLVNRRLRDVYDEMVRYSGAQRDRANNRWGKDRRPPGKESAHAGRMPAGTDSADARACPATPTPTATAPSTAISTVSSRRTVSETESVASRYANQSISGTVNTSDPDAAAQLLECFLSVSGQQKADALDLRALLKKHPVDLIRPVLFWAFTTSTYWRDHLVGSSGFRRAFKQIVAQYNKYLDTILERSGQAAVDKYIYVASNFSPGAPTTSEYAAHTNGEWNQQCSGLPDDEDEERHFVIEG